MHVELSIDFCQPVSPSARVPSTAAKIRRASSLYYYRKTTERSEFVVSRYFETILSRSVLIYLAMHVCPQIFAAANGCSRLATA